MEPMSPALAGRFFATKPPGKPRCSLFDVDLFPSSWKYFLLKAYSWVPSQELALDEGTYLSQDYLPSRGNHIQWLVRGSTQGPKPLSSIWENSEELPVRPDWHDCIPVPFLSLPSPESFTPQQVWFPRALPNKPPASDLCLRVYFTRSSVVRPFIAF